MTALREMFLDTTIKSDNFFISLEKVIGLQLTNKLSSDLIKLYDKMLVDLYSIIEKNRKKKWLDIYKILLRVANNEYALEFQKLINKNLNIDCQFKFLNIRNAFFSMNDFSKYISTELLLSFGIKTHDVIDKSIIEAAFNFDIDTGKILKSKSLSNKIRPIFYIGLPLMFIDKFFKEEDKDLVCNSDEMVSITLHEIGHFIYCISSILYNGYSGLNIGMINRQLIDNFKNNKLSLSEFVTIINHERGQLPSVDDRFIKKLYKLINHICDIFTKIKSKITDKEFNAKTNKLNKQSYNIMNQLALILSITFQMFMLMVFQYRFIRSQIKHATEYSRQLYTRQMHYNNERFADEFVSRFGLSESLSRALIKLHKIESKMNENNFKIKINMYNNVIDMQSLLFGFNIRNIKKLFSMFPYESFYDRINRMIENNISILKDTEVDDFYKDRALKQNIALRQFLKTIKNNKKFHNTYKSLFDNKIIEFIFNLHPLSLLISDFEINEEYTKLYNKIDSIINNILYEDSYELLTTIRNNIA